LTLYRVLTKIVNGFCHIAFKYEIIGKENICDQGNIVIAANHKNLWDPVFIACSVMNREIAAIAKKELFKNKLFGAFLKKLNVIPINRTKPEVSTIKSIIKSVKDGYVLGIFPEGTRVKNDDFGQAKAGLGLFAIKTKSTIVPVTIYSDYKFFGRVTIYIDKPVDISEYFGQKLKNEDYEKISQNIMDIIEANYNKIKTNNL
jgi:1-acyl-sn-glycerol-3-phosphate acyltransferase